MAQGPETEHTDMTPQGLLDLANRKAEEARRENRALTASLLSGREAGLTDRQRATLSRLLRELVSETDAEIRSRIPDADAGADLPGRPAPVGAQSGYAILVESGAFEDGALVEAVLHRLYQHQLERAVRAPAREGWFGDGGDADRDLAAVLGIEEGGTLWRLLAAYQVERSGHSDSYGEPKLLAGDLAPDLRARLYWDCAAAIRETLSGGDGPTAPELDVSVESATRAALAETGGSVGTAAMALAQGLLGDERLSADALLATLRAGEVALFEAALAKLSGLEPRTLRRLLYEPGGEGFAILWRALRFPDALFDELHALTRHARGGPLADPATALQRLRAFRERMPVESALAVLGFWRLSPDYRAARRRVQNRGNASNAEGWR